jgi:hypothetical protein
MLYSGNFFFWIVAFFPIRCRARICARSRSPEIDSKESIPGGPVRLRSPGIDSKESNSGLPVRRIELSYRPARLHRLAESISGLLERLQIWALEKERRVKHAPNCSRILSRATVIRSRIFYDVYFLLYISLPTNKKKCYNTWRRKVCHIHCKN